MIPIDTLTTTLQIRMFGDFAIQYGDRVLTGNIGRSKKVWALIEYLLANRGKEISPDRMMEDLWPDEEYDDPFHILKNLIYRARTALRTLSGADVEFICYDHNCYLWNPEIPCEIDTEIFERYWNDAKKTEDLEMRLEYAYKAFEQYGGDFLPALSELSWVVSKSAYYTSQYNHCVRYLAKGLLMAKRYTDAIHVCETSIVHSPFEEEVHRLLMLAYAKDGRSRKAVDHYQQISRQFYDEFGVTMNPETVKLYRKIAQSMHNVEMDLGVIKEDLMEVSRLPGAFYCDYAIFKNIYRVNARSMVRTGASIHIGLITVTDSKGEIPDVDTIKRVMPALQSCVVDNLRRGDALSLYSSTQLVTMLGQTTYENGCKVLDRVIRLYQREYPMETVKVQYRLEAVDPLDDNPGT